MLQLITIVLQSVHIHSLRAYYANDINSIQTHCVHGRCRHNADAVIHFINESEYVEGIVVLDNGFCYEHMWNKINDLHFDASAEFTTTEEEENIRTYYPINALTREYDIFRNNFSENVTEFIEEYYKINPAHHQQYLNDRNQLDVQ